MRAGLGLCGLLLAANVCAADGAAKDALKVDNVADHKINYSGVFVYQYGNHFETSSIAHLIDSDGEYEKLESLDGPKREIIRHHGQVWCYWNNKMVPADSLDGAMRFPFQLLERLALLTKNYQVKELGTDRVAGYNTRVVLYQSRDSLRYSHKLWIDTNSGLLLKSAVLNEKNQIVEQYTFTELKLGNEADVSRLAGTMPESSKSIASLPVSLIKSGWVVDALPGGFIKNIEILRPMPGKHAPVIQLVFSDGLSAISVFIEPVDATEEGNEALTSRGAVNLYHKVVDNHSYNVVGEVPPKAVMQVLDSIRYNGK